MALVQGIYDLGKPGREQPLYTNRPADAALMQENFMSPIRSLAQCNNVLDFARAGLTNRGVSKHLRVYLLRFVL